MKFLATTILTLIVGVTGANAAGLGEQLQSVGPWHVLKNVDAMTDKVSCVAIYGDNSNVQLTADSFAISLSGRGGIAGYKMRLDDLPAGEMKLPTESEKAISAVLFYDADYQALMQAKRVRFQAITILSTLVNEDIDFSDVQSVVEILKGSSCKA